MIAPTDLELPEPGRDGGAPEGEVPADLRRWQLPRGRHGLPRELVDQSQRERLLASVIRVTAAKGYRASSVADILKEAGVGRETFYRHFKDKEDCFVAANDALLGDLESQVATAYEEPGAWPARVRQGLAAALDWLAAEPDLARVMMAEMGTVGPIASSRFRETFRRFTSVLDDSSEVVPKAREIPNLALIAGGAVFARVYEEVTLGNVEKLPQMLPQLTFELLLPYVGEEAAASERQAAEKEVTRKAGAQ
ncbi:MAG TPA: helix-turn-helix domain-containing protein [Solirubrobacterales bacterium]|nr:helix-turn-helix domain-containing protein [Solirubrobacterales bacterium]